MQNHLPKIVVIVGPTASGKTDLAIKLAKKFSAKGGPSSGWNGAEIVSADSRQIYKGMDIGTAKPTSAEIKAIKHYLIDIKNPDEDYTVAEFKKDAVGAINKIIKKGKVPILVGGTGLYIKAVTDNLEIPSVKPNPTLRKKLGSEIKEDGLESVYLKLLELDPEAAHIVDGKNPRRVIRALEIAITTKKPFSAQRKKGEQLFDALKIGIKLSDAELQKRISERTDKIIKKGLLGEVKKLVKKYGERQIAFDAIGYREIIQYLKSVEGQRKFTSSLRKSAHNLKEVVEMIKKNTWNFSKRQMTWFKKDKEIKWTRKESDVLKLADKFLSNR